MDLIESLPLFSETVPPCLHLAYSNSFNSVYLHLPFFLAGSLPTFSLFLKKGDRSNPSNYRPIALISCLSKFLNLFSRRRFLNTYHFTIFYLIASMASVKAALLVIFWLSLLSLVHPLLEILVKLLL